MVSCIVTAGIISILSIFVFFGDAFSHTGGSAIPSMFNLMFGSTSTYKGYVIQWKQYGGLTFLFVLEIFIIVGALVSFFIAYKIHQGDCDETDGITVSVISGLMSLVALIVSFCTLQITNITNVQLGFGPVFYSILHILVIIFLAVGIIVNKIEPPQPYLKSYKKASSPYLKSTYKSSYLKSTTKPSLSESEKADLILQYKKMFDKGIITEEEFEKKKKELL